MTSSSFVHLHLHTEYSLVDSVTRIKPLMKQVAETMPAVALTDMSNLFAAVKFYRAALAAGVKPILGAEVRIGTVHSADEDSRLVLLAQNDAGYRNLCELVSEAYQKGQRQSLPFIDPAWLTPARCDGLIALSAGRYGDVAQALIAGREQQASAALKRWMALFPDRFYLELQRTGRENEQRYCQAAIGLARTLGCPVVATNEVVFLTPEDFDAHEVRVAINQGVTLADPRRKKPYSAEQYLKTPEQMGALFADVPEAIENTLEIAKRCNVSLSLGTPVLPDFPIPAGMTEAAFFADESWKGLRWRLQTLYPDPAVREAKREAYEQRLQRELDVIIQMGFPGYFLIVADFIQWSKDNGIPVGPGRGSGAGSLVAYVLKITDIDPLPYDLLFERFLNPERVSMPDFDVDFCMDGRDRVIAYVADKYGHEKVSQIITYGSMAAKAVVRDVGRVMGHPYGFVDAISKLVPFEVGMTLSKALNESPDLKARYQNEEEVTELLDMALSLEGLARNCGKHAGGVVIAPTGLTDFCPLYCEQDGSSLVTQFDKDDAEAVGLVKFDFLGLRTLTIIDNAIANCNRRKPGTIDDILLLPLDDVGTFRLLKDHQTTAVFQLESRGMKDLIKRLQPDCFEDIIALVALFRPGPLQSGMVDDFINRKHGREPIVYPHPDLEPVLQPTYGVILYQEQVMQIAQVLAGFTLGGADMLRRAMGKKKPEEMAKMRTLFNEGAAENGIEESTATYIFDLMEKFAGYGFNKSHSAAYALLSYQTAWLKHHHGADFMCAVMSADMDNTDKVVGLIEECHSMGIDVLSPCINHSVIAFTVVSDRQIRYGLGAIKGVGEAALLGLIAERERGGSYRSLLDLARRMDAGKVNKRVLEALVYSGALDDLGPNRQSLLNHLPRVLKVADQERRDALAGQNDLFADLMAPVDEGPTAVPDVGEFIESERLRLEKESLGLFLTGHPFDAFRQELVSVTQGSLKAHCDKVEPSGGEGFRRRAKPVTVAGIVLGVRTIVRESGKMAIATLDDRTGRLEVVVQPELLEQALPLLGKDVLVVVSGDLSFDDFSGGYRVKAKALSSLTDVRRQHATAIRLSLSASEAPVAALIESFNAVFAEPENRGIIPLCVSYQTQSAQGLLWLGGEYRLDPHEALLQTLESLPGCRHLKLDYQLIQRERGS